MLSKKTIFLIKMGSMLLLIAYATVALPQPVDNKAIGQMITRFKDDQRGPYKDIRWFCIDGTFRIPQERCPEPSPQRARYKDEVVALSKTNGIYLGQILSSTPQNDFWDVENSHSRLKQYQLEKYIRSVDDGWILRKGQYYRGALQAEDEENWGFHFFSAMLEKDQNIKQNYFLLREATRDIPHQGDENRAQTIRSMSLVISDSYPAFMNARIKIHGQPDVSDIDLVQAFKKQHIAKITPELNAQFDELIKEMSIHYQPVQASSFGKYTKKLPKESTMRLNIDKFITTLYSQTPGLGRITSIAERLYQLRNETLTLKTGSARLALFDISILLERILLQDLQQWRPNNIRELIQVSQILGMALTGAGYIESWEWDAIKADLAPPTANEISIDVLNTYLDRSRSLVEWATGMVRATYQPTISLFAGFEPLAHGFIDDRIRLSLLLPIGNYVGMQGEFFAQSAGLSNSVMKIADQGHVRGLNPGYAKGELVVLDDPEEVEVVASKIYLFDRPPSDLKPVAGIATVTEGNAVSHVQLLARNLGIPNAIISRQNLESMKKYSGQEVFYAVSNAGTVIMKPVSEMTTTEKQLFAVKQRVEERIEVPVGEIQLGRTEIINLKEVRSKDSGKLCGPKAANLGQLKAMFPDHVVDGMVIPFGIFLEHMKQKMPNRNSSYWDYLNAIFAEARSMNNSGQSQDQVERYTLAELTKLREAIKSIEFLPGFSSALEKNFQTILGKPLGQVPVFLRSDTNMEDLKDFSGAGLNLTVFNALSKDKILQGIRDVWASPYTERSYKWRQNYLLNPENVYPSILIIPSVDVDYSGVLITKGIISNNSNDLTIAFSRGAGGAVDGQAAESYLLKSGGSRQLLSPAREPTFNRLPTTGGTQKNQAYFDQPVLNETNLTAIIEMAGEVKSILPKTPGVGSKGPFDVELGFKSDKLWLFQVRPFVENKKALSSEYLQSISPSINRKKLVALSTLLP